MVSKILSKWLKGTKHLPQEPAENNKLNDTAIEPVEPPISAEVFSPQSSQHESHGLFVLHPPPQIPCKQHHAEIDIVAVHGLNGGPRSTWLDESSGKIWLEDFLPTSIPKSRIMSFGYNSALAFSRNRSGIEFFAKDLLNRLRLMRSPNEARERPVLFIAHSLGGIIVKKALIIAHEAENFYGSILKATTGIIFMATPHQGSSLASWSLVYTQIVTAVTSSRVIRNDLLQNLQDNSAALMEISRQFVQRSVGLKIASFLEQEIEQPLKDLIVADQSAIMGLPNEMTLPVNAHHRNICRYSNSQSQTYILVEGVIREFSGFKLDTIISSTITSQWARLDLTQNRQLVRTVALSEEYQMLNSSILNPGAMRYSPKAPNTVSLPIRGSTSTSSKSLADSTNNFQHPVLQSSESNNFMESNIATSTTGDQNMTIRISGLKNMNPSMIHGDKVFSSEISVPASTTLSNLTLELLKKHPNLEECKLYRFAGRDDPIDVHWRDVFTSPIVVTSGRPCYDPKRGYEINLRQTLADFFSRAFPRPIETRLQTLDDKISGSVMAGRENDQDLRISFMRTIRMPEDKRDYPLPPGLGTFPLLDIRKFCSRLPTEVVAQGGLFLPMYQREAMWIWVLCDPKKKYAIRPYVGGVNAITGRSSIADMSTLINKSNKLSVKQDYIVAPKQRWLDGIATRPGVVRQFVATKMVPPSQQAQPLTWKNGSKPRQTNRETSDSSISQPTIGASIEWQMTGTDSVGGIQLQIIPAHETDRMHFGSVADFIPLSATGPLYDASSNKSWISYHFKTPDGIQCYQPFETPRALGLESGDVIHVKNIAKRNVKVREKKVSDLLRESPKPLKTTDIMELEAHYADKKKLVVKLLTGKYVTVEYHRHDRVLDVMFALQEELQIPTDQQRLVYNGKQLEKSLPLHHYEIYEGCTVTLVLRLRGGGEPYGIYVNFDGKRIYLTMYSNQSIAWLKDEIEKRWCIPRASQVLSCNKQILTDDMLCADLKSNEFELSISPPDGVRMGIGAGGNIVQHIEEDESDPRAWDLANSKILNVQMVNSIDFRSITGLPSPPSPIGVWTYANLGLPFFEEYREGPPSSISGDFKGIQTVGQLTKEQTVGSNYGSFEPSKGQQQGIGSEGAATAEPALDLKIVMLDVDDTVPALYNAQDDYTVYSDDDE